MNKPECVCLRGTVVIRHACGLLLCLILFFSGLNQVYAQDIELGNPSMESPLLATLPPAPWKRFEQSPDVQPGWVGVTTPPMDGKTYIGMIAGAAWSERLMQELVTPLRANRSYTISFGLAFPERYFSAPMCYGGMVIYGANAPGEKGDVLWKSGIFTHKEWRTYKATLTPEKDYKYFVFGPYRDSTCTQMYSAVLVDNFSPYIAEVPRISATARNTCKGQQAGQVSVDVLAGKGPYQYLWEPGGYRDSVVSHLDKGSYRVTVTSASGATASEEVQVGEYEMTADIQSDELRCYGDKGKIAIVMAGGENPYLFSMNGGATYQKSAVFENLQPGNYDLAIKDVFSCVLRIKQFNIPAIAPMEVQSIKTGAASCSNVKDGKLEFTVTGGTRPYMYEVSGVPAGPDSIIVPLESGEYTYRITDQHNCEVRGSTNVSKESRECAVLIPSAFSPNGDGMNDIFRAKVHDAVSDFRMAVYGRWGQLIFESRNPDTGWDGTQKGSGAPAGSYLWVVTYTDSKQQAMQQQGTLVLVR